MGKGKGRKRKRKGEKKRRLAEERERATASLSLPPGIHESAPILDAIADPPTTAPPVHEPPLMPDLAAAVRPAAGNRWWRMFRGATIIWAVVSSVLAVLGGVTAIYALRPRITLSMTTLPERQPSFLTFFIIRNDGLFPVKYLYPMCYLHHVKIGDWGMDNLATYADKLYVLGPNEEVEVACTQTVIAIWLDQHAPLEAVVTVAVAYSPWPFQFGGPRMYKSARYVAWDDPNDGFREPLRWKPHGAMPSSAVESLYQSNWLDRDEYLDYPAYGDYPGSPEGHR